MPADRFLIDTHTFLWMAAEPERLSSRARRICTSADLLLSVASIWEIGIKFHIGKLPLPAPPAEYIERNVRYAGITILPISYRHALTAAALPLVHKDPFDRMLAAQCLEERLPFITKDKILSHFGIEIIW